MIWEKPPTLFILPSGHLPHNAFIYLQLFLIPCQLPHLFMGGDMWKTFSWEMSAPPAPAGQLISWGEGPVRVEAEHVPLSSLGINGLAPPLPSLLVWPRVSQVGVHQLISYPDWQVMAVNLVGRVQGSWDVTGAGGPRAHACLAHLRAGAARVSF